MQLNIAESFLPLFDKSDPDYYRRYKIFYGGRGGAKTIHFAKAALLRGYERPERILCAREYQNSISDSVLKTLEDEIELLGLQAFYKVQNNAIYGLNGTEFLFKGLKNNIQSVKSTAGITIAFVEEAQTVSEKSWDILIPTIRAEGSEIWIGFNPDEEDDPTYQRFVVNPPPNSLVRKVNYSDNPFIPKVLLDEMEDVKSRDIDLWKHIWLGETRRAGLGAVYGTEMAKAKEDGRICAVPYTPSAPVITAWDMGYGDATVIWFLQIIGKEPRFIDYYANNLHSLDHYVDYVKKKPYSYDMHVLPHDAGHNSLRTGTTMAQQMQGMGLGNIGKDIKVLPVDAVQTGIELVRQLLPQVWFDAEKCADGVKALSKYHYEYNEDRKRFSQKPVHDWASDPCDAARCMATYLATQKTKTTYTHIPGSSAWK